MYSGKIVAEELKSKYKLDVVKVLWRADAHPWTYNTAHGGFKQDRMHLTLDVKTSDMETSKEHLTVHAYIKVKPDGSIENMFDIDSVVPKLKKGSTTELAIEQDSYVNKSKGGKITNNWDPAHLETYPAPPELKNVVLGKGFITVVEDALNHIAKEKQKSEIDKATTEESDIRKALAVIPSNE